MTGNPTQPDTTRQGTSVLDELRGEFWNHAQQTDVLTGFEARAIIDAFEAAHPGLADLGVCAHCGKPFEERDNWVQDATGKYHNGSCFYFGPACAKEANDEV